MRKGEILVTSNLKKLLVTSNFSFSHNVVQSYISLVRQNAALCDIWLSIFISHRLRNMFLQLILISLDSTSWELHQHSSRMCGPMKIPKLTPAPGNRTWDLMIARPTLYLTTTDTTYRGCPPHIAYSSVKETSHHDVLVKNAGVSENFCACSKLFSGPTFSTDSRRSRTFTSVHTSSLGPIPVTMGDYQRFLKRQKTLTRTSWCDCSFTYFNLKFTVGCSTTLISWSYDDNNYGYLLGIL